MNKIYKFYFYKELWWSYWWNWSLNKACILLWNRNWSLVKLPLTGVIDILKEYYTFIQGNPSKFKPCCQRSLISVIHLLHKGLHDQTNPFSLPGNNLAQSIPVAQVLSTYIHSLYVPPSISLKTTWASYPLNS